MRRTRRLTGGMIWTLLGYLLPLAAALIIIPILIHRMGPDRFGLLTFIWMIVGYSTLLDLGIGRALTQGIAEHLGRGEEGEIPLVIQSGLALLLLVGTVGAVGLALSSGWLSGRFLKVPTEIIPDAKRCLSMAALAIPLVILGAALRGILEAYQRFREISLVRSAVGVLLYLSAVPILRLTKDVWVIVAMLVIVRILEVTIYAVQCFLMVPGILRAPSWRITFLKRLFSFGLWSTANNLVGSLMSMAYTDRLFISTFLGTGALAYFSTPFDMVVRVLILPTALVGVLFPALSSLGKGSLKASELSTQSIRIVAFGTAPLFLMLLVLAKPILTIWLGAEFSQKSSLIFQLISAGMYAVSIGYVPFAFIQAMGRPDLTAKRHFLELPFYLIVSFYLIRNYGAVGGGLVWCLWAVIDLVLILHIMKNHLIGPVRVGIGNKWLVIVGFMVTAFVVGNLSSRYVQFSTGIALPIGFLVWGWQFLLPLEDREAIRRWFLLIPGNWAYDVRKKI